MSEGEAKVTTYGRNTGTAGAKVKAGAKVGADGATIVIQQAKPKTHGELTTVACLVGATAVTYVGMMADGKRPTMRPLIGMFVAGALLLAVSMWSDEVAAAFAILLLVTSIVVNGESMFKVIGKVTS